MSLASAETSSTEELSNEPPNSNPAEEVATPSRRRDLSISEKVELLIKYDGLPKMSQSKAARELGISKQLVCRILQQRADIMQAWLHNKGNHRKRKRCGKDGEVETALREWFDRACAEGATITGPIMRKKAEELARDLGKVDFVATDGWFSRWRKRENIVLFGKGRSDQNASEVSAGQWPVALAAYSAECVYGGEGNSREQSKDAGASSSCRSRTDLHSVSASPPNPLVTGLLPQHSGKREGECFAKCKASPVRSQRLAASQPGVSHLVSSNSPGSGHLHENQTMVGMADSNPSEGAPFRPESPCDVKPQITSTTSEEHELRWYPNPEAAPLSAYPPDRIYSTEISEVNYQSKSTSTEKLRQRLSVLCCANLCGAKQKLLVVGQRDRACFRNVRQTPVDYYFNDEARVTPHIIFDWLIKWDRILDHDIVLMMDDCQNLSSITSFQHLKFLPVPESLGGGKSLSQALHSSFEDLKRRRLERLVNSNETEHQSTDFLSFLHLTAQAWQNVPTSCIRSHFIRCGLLTDPDSLCNELLSSSHSASEVKSEGYESVSESDMVVDHQDPVPPTNEDIRKALAVLTQAVYHRAEEFNTHYQYETFIDALM